MKSFIGIINNLHWYTNLKMMVSEHNRKNWLHKNKTTIDTKWQKMGFANAFILISNCLFRHDISIYELMKFCYISLNVLESVSSMLNA